MALRLLVLVALAASIDALPSKTDMVVPEGMMMQVAFSSMTPTAFISAMTKSGGSKADCGTFADTTIDTITKAVTAQQAILGAVDNGAGTDGCAAQGQTLVTETKEAVVAAQGDLTAKTEEAKTALAAKETACTATVDFAVNLDTLEASNQCFQYTQQGSYEQAKTKCDSAKSTLATANQAVSTADTKATGAATAAANAVTAAAQLKAACQCRVKKSQATAWTAAETAHASHAADWKQAHEIKCALDTASTTCNVPTCPTVNKPTVGAGVADATCRPTQTPAPTLPTQTPAPTLPTQTPAPTRCDPTVNLDGPPVPCWEDDGQVTTGFDAQGGAPMVTLG